MSNNQDSYCLDSISIENLGNLSLNDLLLLSGGDSCADFCISRIPSDWQDQIVSQLNEANNNPSGYWQDYNYLYNSWLIIKNYNNSKIICLQKIPGMPSVGDYTNLSSTRTTPKETNSYKMNDGVVDGVTFIRTDVALVGKPT